MQYIGFVTYGYTVHRRTDSEGLLSAWQVTGQTPTILLDGDIQGIEDVAGANRVAERMVRNVNPSLDFCDAFFLPANSVYTPDPDEVTLADGKATDPRLN